MVNSLASLTACYNARQSLMVIPIVGQIKSASRTTTIIYQWPQALSKRHLYPSHVTHCSDATSKRSQRIWLSRVWHLCVYSHDRSHILAGVYKSLIGTQIFFWQGCALEKWKLTHTFTKIRPIYLPKIKNLPRFWEIFAKRMLNLPTFWRFF